MAKITLNNVVSVQNTSVINDNFQKIATQLNDLVFYRDVPTGEPNQLENPLDANGERIYNLPEPVNDHEAATLQTVKDHGVGGQYGNTLRTPDPVNVLPSSTGRANRLLSFDASGQPQVLFPSNDSATQLRIDLASDTGSSLIGFKKSFPSAVHQTLDSVLSERVSLLTFGTATTDWAPVFNKAFTELPEGSTLFIPAGTYPISTNITCSRNKIRIVGASSSSTIIFRAPELAIDVGSFLVEGASNIYISGIAFDGNKANQTNPASGLILRSQSGGVQDITINDVVVRDWGERTLALFAAGFACYGTQRLRITDSYATGNAHYGFNFFEAVDVIAANLFSIGNGSHGFGAAGMREFNFSACHSKDNRIQGFWFRNVEDGTLAACTAIWSSPSTEFVRRGLQLKGTGTAQEAAGNNRVRNISVEGFVCRNSLDTLTASSESAGIYMQVDTGGALTGVNIQGGVFDDCGYGALLLNGEHIYLDGILFRNTRNIAVKDDGVNHFGYNNLRIVDNRKQGIVSRGRYGDITGTKVRSRQLDTTSAYSAVEYADRSDVTISDNEASSLEGTNVFRSTIHLSGAFTTRVRVFENRIKSTAAAITKSVDYGTSGSGNADWDNFNNTGLAPYADKRFAGVVHIGDGYSEIMPGIFSGNGTPEGAVAARIGSIYLRRDGAAGTSFYVKEQFTGNTGWVAK